MKYSITTTAIKNGVGEWDSTLCEIYNNDVKIGAYTRSYYAFAKDTFYPFTFDGKDYALISKDYERVDVLSLPSCEIVEIKEECREQTFHFCPTEIVVPKCDSDGYMYLPKDAEYAGIQEYCKFAFLLGCIWGDDSSMKLNILDLSGLADGEIWYVNADGERKWLYEEHNGDISELDINTDDDGNIERIGVKQLTWIDFSTKKEIAEMKLINNPNKVKPNMDADYKEDNPPYAHRWHSVHILSLSDNEATATVEMEDKTQREVKTSNLQWTDIV